MFTPKNHESLAVLYLVAQDIVRLISQERIEHQQKPHPQDFHKAVIPGREVTFGDLSDDEFREYRMAVQAFWGRCEGLSLAQTLITEYVSSRGAGI